MNTHENPCEHQREHCPVCREQAISNIIDSVAKEQAALAEILEAEADKIKKIICMPVCPETLLDANKSVERTVASISLLETVLQLKLRLFEDCLCPRRDHRSDMDQCQHQCRCEG